MEKIVSPNEALVEAGKLFRKAMREGKLPPIFGRGLCHDEELREFGRRFGLTPDEIADSLQLSELPNGGGYERVQERILALAGRLNP